MICCGTRNMDDVIRRANNTEYGLASGVFTRDVSRALQFAERIEAGTVFVNTYNKTDVAAPFGGFKQSGFGKDLGKYRIPNSKKIESRVDAKYYIASYVTSTYSVVTVGGAASPRQLLALCIRYFTLSCFP